MMEINGHQHVLEHREWIAYPDRPLTQLGQRHSSDLHGSVQLEYGVGANIPKVSVGVGAAGGTSIAVTNEGEIPSSGLGENLVERGFFIGALGKILIAISDRHLVPLTNPYRV